MAEPITSAYLYVPGSAYSSSSSGSDVLRNAREALSPIPVEERCNYAVWAVAIDTRQYAATNGGQVRSALASGLRKIVPKTIEANGRTYQLIE